LKPNEIAIFGRTEAVLHDRAEPALEATGLKGQLLNDDDPADEDHVSLGTMHRAKGLEFKAVAIVGCDLSVMRRFRCPRRSHDNLRVVSQIPGGVVR